MWLRLLCSVLGILCHFLPQLFCCNSLYLPSSHPVSLQQKSKLTVVTIPKPLENNVAISSKCQRAVQDRERRGSCALPFPLERITAKHYSALYLVMRQREDCTRTQQQWNLQEISWILYIQMFCFVRPTVQNQKWLKRWSNYQNSCQ